MVRASVGHSVLLALARLRGAVDLVSFSLGLAFVRSTRRARGLACCDSRMSEGTGDGRLPLRLSNALCSQVARCLPAMYLGLVKKGSERGRALP
jgi:hypothetical protein